MRFLAHIPQNLLIAYAHTNKIALFRTDQYGFRKPPKLAKTFHIYILLGKGTLYTYKVRGYKAVFTKRGFWKCRLK